MAKTKSPLKFERAERDGLKLWVAVTPSGGEIRKATRNGDMDVYDAKGRFLGISGSDDEAYDAANDGHILDITLDTVSDLSLWELWNDATINCGTVVMESVDDSNVQIIGLGNDVYLLAKRDDTGWETEILHDGDIDSYWPLRICDAPHKLQ